MLFEREQVVIVIKDENGLTSTATAGVVRRNDDNTIIAIIQDKLVKCREDNESRNYEVVGKPVDLSKLFTE